MSKQHKLGKIKKKNGVKKQKKKSQNWEVNTQDRDLTKNRY